MHRLFVFRVHLDKLDREKYFRDHSRGSLKGGLVSGLARKTVQILVENIGRTVGKEEKNPITCLRQLTARLATTRTAM
jgi:hypothetical protein